jgi:hypothetical protein
LLVKDNQAEFCEVFTEKDQPKNDTMQLARLTLRLLAFVVLFGVLRAEEEQQCEASTGECANPEVLATADVSAEADPETIIADKEDPSCPSRPYIIKCAGEYLDTNNNGALERDELQHAIDSLPWYSRGIISILGSVDKMMKKCDLDGDGAISMDYDMKNNGETCLATCFKRLAFKKSFFPDCKPDGEHVGN